MDSEELENFLAELSALTNKYRIVIFGCGCCGSPFLEKEKKGDMTGHYEVSGLHDNLRYEG